MDGHVSSSSGKKENITFNIRTLTPAEMRVKAAGALAIYWGLMIFFLPLPPIHWITTPFFFFFGIYQATKKLGQKEYIQAFTVTCPECQKSIPMKERVASFPLSFTCQHCRYNLKLEPAKAEPSEVSAPNT